MAELAGKRTLDKTKVEQRISLSKYIDQDLSDGQKVQIGQAIVDRIVERSESQKDVNGQRFPKYSKDYKTSEDFERYGKSASDRNMTLRGNMLEGIDFDVSGNDLVVKMSPDQAAKAHGNITGQEGKWGYERDFFGVTDSEMKKIARDIVPKTTQELDASASVLINAINSAFKRKNSTRLFDDLFGSVFDGQDNN